LATTRGRCARRIAGRTGCGQLVACLVTAGERLAMAEQRMDDGWDQLVGYRAVVAGGRIGSWLHCAHLWFVTD
jgi:hypothetical protein